jgi:hypothetical protein
LKVFVIDQYVNGRNQRTGEFRGWEARVPDVDRRSDIGGVFTSGREVLAPWEVPEHLVITANTGKLPSLFRTGSHALIVSEVLFDVIEAFDPGMHQGFPLRVTWRNLTDCPGNWRLLNIHRFENSISEHGTRFRPTYGVRRVQRKGVTVIEDDRDRIIARHLDYQSKTVVVNPSALSGACHLWREPKFGDAILCSEPLWKALNAAPIKRIAGFPAILLRS